VRIWIKTKFYVMRDSLTRVLPKKTEKSDGALIQEDANLQFKVKTG